MIQGWCQKDYFILFEDQAEASLMTERYAVNSFLPGYILVGIKSWDDFILCDADNNLYTVPTIPLAAKELCPCSLEIDSAGLRADTQVADKIKWYIQPIIFGGDPKPGENMTWVTLDQHIDLVKWWNNQYRSLQ
ncbi:hypothetical protein [Prosthecobacter vanneervenii]|uniref:Uncharacterized protein n=1 Tax=Prosthecobacter vanneervenii TaxID=48466 RepID=A0A7W7YGC7_9BACT|nr:hypothetical protein [Prosthecobacter vanneervenii]MBB5035604.1 hypothetical protein [Prosthecobacter vanneervenii]